MPLTAFITPGSRRQVSDTLEEVFETPATCVMTLHSQKTVGAPPLDARILLMPLKSDLGDVSRLLGAFVSVGDMGRSPRRFDVTNTVLRPILAEGAAPLPEKISSTRKPDTPAIPAAHMPGFAEPTASFKTETPRSDAPYLRLVKNDD